MGELKNHQSFAEANAAKAVFEAAFQLREPL